MTQPTEFYNGTPPNRVTTPRLESPVPAHIAEITGETVKQALLRGNFDGAKAAIDHARMQSQEIQTSSRSPIGGGAA